ncbi:MAG: bifunctional glutamate N-acetyltransferase/amino-acid acetyltransferase ArgJ [Peptococcaceae bacterium]|nr:MAG: bifunctional glutamate N-acetyltransferase/amino-acid acetyltransferase ArgJ [Peptococcaceae bacterium]
MSGGVTVPAGFLAGAAFANVNRRNKKDVAVVYSRAPAAAAGVFTTNVVKAAPVVLTRHRLAGGTARAIVINSGNANACNGKQGELDAAAMAAEVARVLDIPEDYVLVASTGVIGQRMPMERILPAVREAAGGLMPEGGRAVAEAIMTTDTVAKEAAAQVVLGGGTVTVGGMAKGSGMIHPDMATMLCFITTDAAVSVPFLKQALKRAVDKSFNMITIDGDTSTNDMVVALANGLAGNPEITGEGEDAFLFQEALTVVCTGLAKAVARDGEGANRLIEVEVRNAPSERDAGLAARAVAGSSLVKTAVFGQDANWGRVVCAAGYSGAQFDPERVDVFLGGEQVARDGSSLCFDEERVGQALKGDPVRIAIDFKCGEYSATAWGCDLSYDYVRINADYRT